MEGGCRSMRNCIVKYDKASKSLTIFHYAGQGENWTSIIDTERAFLPSGCVGKKNLIVVNLSFSFRRIWKKNHETYLDWIFAMVGTSDSLWRSKRRFGVIHRSKIQIHLHFVWSLYLNINFISLLLSLFNIKMRRTITFSESGEKMTSSIILTWNAWM